MSVGDVRLYFEVFGQERAIARDGSHVSQHPALIGLHGGPGLDGTKLRHVLPALADITQVIVPDQRGHGLSDHGDPSRWNLAQWAADVKAFADALEIGRPIILGESFGGFVAQTYAGTYSDHPAALIVVSSGPRLIRPDEIAARTDIARPAEVAAAVTGGEQTGDREAAAVRWASEVEPLLRVHRDAALDRVEGLRLRTMEVNEHFEPEGLRMDLRPRLANVRCPTLVVVGEHDILVPPHLAAEIVDALPPGLGQLEVIPGASHAVLTDRPDAAWALIREFASRAV